MFERYTEKARRVIFFARFEASRYGSSVIASEHLMLAVFREDEALVQRLLSPPAIEAIRQEIDGQMPQSEFVRTNVDLPLSDECKRVLAYANEEAERLGQRFIAPEHLLLGLLREGQSPTAKLLRKYGMSLPEVRKKVEEYGIGSENFARNAQERARRAAPSGDAMTQGVLPLGFPVNTVRVSSLSASVAFYQKLSLRPAHQVPFEGMAILSNGPFLFVLYLSTMSRNLLCFLVKDIEFVAGELKASGIPFDRPRKRELIPYSLLLRDPDDNHVCLLSYRYLAETGSLS